MPTPTNKPPINPVVQSSKQAKRALLVSLIAGVLALLAIAFALFAWQALHKTDLKQIQSNQLKLKTDIKQLHANLNFQKTELASTQRQLTHLIRLANNTQRQRTLGAVAYLLHRANLHLELGKNANAAINLLTFAKQRIVKTDDASLIPLANAIDKDIAALKTSTSFNVVAVVLKINQINRAIQSMSATPDKPSAPKITSAQQAQEASLPWKKRFLHSLAGLKQLVIIRHQSQPAMPLLSPQQQLFLKENLQLKLFQAQWSALHQKKSLYQQSLITAYHWLGGFYKDKAAVAAIKTQIKQLQKINVDPALPTINNALNALNQALNVTSRLIKKTKEPVSITPPSKPRYKTPSTKQPQKKSPLKPTNPAMEI